MVFCTFSSVERAGQETKNNYLYIHTSKVPPHFSADVANDLVCDGGVVLGTGVATGALAHVQGHVEE